MFGSTILDIAIGMAFVYLLLSLVCSAANEVIEAFLKGRASHLEAGIRNLLGNQGLAEKVYGHDLVRGLLAKKKRKPSYVPSKTFALALLNTLFPDGVPPAVGQTGGPVINQLAGIRETVAKLPANDAAAPIQNAILALIDDAQGNIVHLRTNIENWYDAAMDRVSGGYKRRVHIIIMVLGFAVAVAMNADSISILKALANNKALRESVVAAADAYAKANANPSPSPSPSPSATPTPAQTNEAPAATPTPAPSASPSPSPSPSATPCWEEACKDDPNSAACKLKKSECIPCWEEASKDDPNSPKCKLKKSQCELEGLGLPLGWTSADDKWPGLRFWEKSFWNDWYVQLWRHWLGWLLTALAISLGAPFWFDLLNKFIVIRSTVKPKEKSQEEKSKD
jgi:cell division septation protein DedD